MPQLACLLDVAKHLSSLSEDLCIVAVRPWSENSACQLVAMPDGVTRSELARGNLEYFLEVFVAREVCEVLGTRRPTPHEIAQLLVFYAENDAYPSWVYEADT